MMSVVEDLNSFVDEVAKIVADKSKKEASPLEKWRRSKKRSLHFSVAPQDREHVSPLEKWRRSKRSLHFSVAPQENRGENARSPLTEEEEQKQIENFFRSLSFLCQKTLRSDKEEAFIRGVLGEMADSSDEVFSLSYLEEKVDLLIPSVKEMIKKHPLTDKEGLISFIEGWESRFSPSPLLPSPSLSPTSFPR